MTPIYISEGEYIAYSKRQRQELADAVAQSGLTVLEIAEGTRMRWETVNYVKKGKQVRCDTADRIRYFLDQYHKAHEKK